MMRQSIRSVAMIFWIASSWCQLPADDTTARLRDSLLFHTSFDQGIDADLAKGDPRLWTARSMDQRDQAQLGLPTGMEVTHSRDGGRFGGAVRFHKSSGPMVFYRASRNFPAMHPDWSGTVSFWLSADPPGELNEGFCDPIQITSKSWDDSSLFVEFEKRPAGIPFRLGIYADKSIWNPANRKFSDIPAHERPLVTVEKPPFEKGRWTHVAITLAHGNTGKNDGISKLYLNGNLAGEISPRQQTFTWDDSQSAIMLGLNFVGGMDDLAVFHRELTAREVERVYALESGVRELHSAK